MNVLNSVELARKRALDFEEEYRQAIEELATTEKHMKELSELRGRWLDSETSSVVLDSGIFKKKIEILERQAEILEARLILDKFHLEGYYEAQHLKQLVAATKPIQKRDNGEKIRAAEMEQLMREGADELARALQESILLRQNIASECKALHSKLDRAILENKSLEEQKREALTKSLDNFLFSLRNAHATSLSNLKAVTEQYLVLRHNSRIATEVLAKSQNESALQRNNIKQALKECRERAAEQVASAEDACREELEVRLKRQREEVMRYESALESKWTRNDEIRVESKYTLKELRKALRYYDYKYTSLQHQRRAEITTVQGELNRLRQEIANAESALLRRTTSGCKGKRNVRPVAPEKNVRGVNVGSDESMLLQLHGRLAELKKELNEYE